MIPATLRAHAVLSLSVLATRAALYAAGVRFDFALDWMWLSDPADLRDRLAQTLYYFHAFPPGMNLLTGVLLKLGGAGAAGLALATFWTLGLVIVNALFHLLRATGVPVLAAAAVALVFSLLPQSIYFEHLYLYEYPVAALLVVAAVLFHAAARQPSFWRWSAFFLACAVVGLTRSTFHLVWFGALVALAFMCAPPLTRASVLRAACLPACLLLALYAKNFLVFGVFDAFTFGPVSQTLATVWHLPPDVRAAWIAQGRLSPMAGVDVYAGPRAYLPLVGASPSREWPSQLTALDRPSVHAPNYNHWIFLDVNRTRRADALHYVAARPWAYLSTAAAGLRDLFTASTQWHPLDAAGRSPHAHNRQVLGRYEALVNGVFHRFPIAPIGLYALLPAVMLWAGLRARALVRSPDPAARALGWLVAFCLFQIVYVAAASSLFTYRESARYRFQIEPAIWVLAAMCRRHEGHERLATKDTKNRPQRTPRIGH